MMVHGGSDLAKDSSLFRDDLRRRCAEAGVLQPAITNKELEALVSATTGWLVRWEAVEVGQTVELDLPKPEHGPSPSSRQ
jgi:hypothetical protein